MFFIFQKQKTLDLGLKLAGVALVTSAATTLALSFFDRDSSPGGCGY